MSDKLQTTTTKKKEKKEEASSELGTQNNRTVYRDTFVRSLADSSYSDYDNITCNIVSFPRGLPCPSSRNLNDKIKILDQFHHTQTMELNTFQPYTRKFTFMLHFFRFFYIQVQGATLSSPSWKIILYLCILSTIGILKKAKEKLYSFDFYIGFYI